MVSTLKNTKILFLHGFLHCGAYYENLSQPLLNAFKEKNISIEAMFPDGLVQISRTKADKRAWMYWDTTQQSEEELFKNKEVEFKNMENTLDYLQKLGRENQEIESIIGYSQGGNLLFYLFSILEQKKDLMKEVFPNLSSLVIFSAFSNPRPKNSFISSTIEEIIDKKSYKISIPSLHIIGEKDTYIPVERSVECSTYFDEKTREVVYHKGDHTYPNIEQFDFMQIVDFIVKHKK